MKTVSHDGRDTAYRIVRRGASGPTVLYVHGSGGSHRVWAHQYGPDGPSHPAAALDLSGHGESEDVDTTAGPETLLAYADDVRAVAHAVEADVLVGNSLGGAVVQRILLDEDHELAAAVLAGTGATLPVAESLRTWLAEDFERAVEWLHGTDRLFHDADEQTRERSVETMYAVGQAVTERDFLSCHTFDVREQLHDVQIPVLALVGEHDTLTPPSYHELLASELPHGELTVLDDAAHLAMVDQPVAFNASLSGFFDTHDL
ncbi:MAG: alpha/beta hydrolase [Haloarculaceae archaeon]